MARVVADDAQTLCLGLERVVPFVSNIPCCLDTYELLNNCEKHNVHQLKKQPFVAILFMKRGVYAKWTGNYLNHRFSLVKLCRSWSILSAYFAWR